MYLKPDRPSYRQASERSLQYFNSWLERLAIGQHMYEDIVARLETLDSSAPD